MSQSMLQQVRGNEARLYRCSLCGEPAAAELRYARLRLCKKHFIEFINRKVERTLRRVGALRKGVKILVAISGGKDSAVTLAALSDLAKKYGIEVYAIHLRLGFGEFSAKVEERVRSLCNMLGIPCIVVDVAEAVGDPVHILARKARRPACSVCGLVKRYFLNASAIELGADYVALGHNADDIIAYSIKAFLNQDLEALAKFGPVTTSIDDLAVARLRPLYEVYEKEDVLYAILRGLPVVFDKCPFRPEAPMEDTIKEMINKLEDKHPGIKISFLRRLEKRIKLYGELAGSAKPGRCKYCGLISQGDECSFCRLTRRIYGEPRGPKVREYLKQVIQRSFATR
ncbi:TIGR00269 family protein [Hyperthermus butylicus]|uniref:ATPase of the PP-loop superfamily n=1 Tax=Hyperthermus butylicus (strain DSM 5456 / JCM 9403 / PLM1-5) TaxID=415426 RepID=A2BJ08_HYPBU|nr:TIGR00269 family protein [Hyperthermus butylicus]ABM79969.1 putative ATPase of the PP-loop superfamily [Hyperthermus butylicus DSM 5456]